MANEKKLSPFEFLSEDFFDEGTFTETDSYLKSGSGIAEAVTGFGRVDDIPVFAFAQDSAVCGGAMSKAQAKKITKLYNSALKTGAPIIGFFDSVGGRLEEKYDMLAAYGDIMSVSAQLSGVVPRISVVMGDCYGASALIATCADLVIMTEDAKLSLYPDSPDASAEANLRNGTVQFVVKSVDKSDEAFALAEKLIRCLPSNNLDAVPCDALVEGEWTPYAEADKLPKFIADDDSLICVGSPDGVCTAFGKVMGSTVGFVVSHGESISSDEAKKIIRHIRFCDAFSIPVVTIVDAEGFESLRDASSLAAAYAEATTAKISVIAGKAVGSVYIALAGTSSGSDIVLALPDAVVSPIAPKAAAYILDPSIAELPYGEQEAAIRRYISDNLSAVKAAEDGYIDDIAEKEELRTKLIRALDILSAKRVASLPKKHTTNI